MLNKSNELLPHSQVLKAIMSIPINEYPSQKKIAKLISMDYSKFNHLVKKLIIKDMIKSVVIRGRTTKYLVNTSNQYYQKHFLTIPIDTNISIINNFKSKKYLKELIYISKKRLSKTVSKSIEKIDKKIINNRLYYFYENKRFTPDQFINHYILGKPVNKRWRAKNSGKIENYFSPIAGKMFFNVDFGLVDSVDFEQMKLNIERFYAIVKNTQFEKLKFSEVRKLFRIFDAKIVFTKIMYLINGLKTNIRNLYKYLYSCVANVTINQERFVDTVPINDVADVVTFPRLKMFHKIYRSSKDTREMFEKIGLKYSHMHIWDSFYKIWNNSNFVINDVSLSMEGY